MADPPSGAVSGERTPPDSGREVVGPWCVQEGVLPNYGLTNSFGALIAGSRQRRGFSRNLKLFPAPCRALRIGRGCGGMQDSGRGMAAGRSLSELQVALTMFCLLA